MKKLSQRVKEKLIIFSTLSGKSEGWQGGSWGWAGRGLAPKVKLIIYKKLFSEAFFVGVRWTLGCFFLWGSDGLRGAFFVGDGLWGAFFVGVRWTLGCFFCEGQMDFGGLFLWGSDGLWGAFFVGVRWTLGCFFCGGSDGLCGAFFVGVRWTLGCFFCGGQMDFGVLFLWGSDGLWGAFFVGVRWTLGCFFLLRLFSTEGTDGLGKKNLAGSLVFGVLFLWGSVVLF